MTAAPEPSMWCSALSFFPYALTIEADNLYIFEFVSFFKSHNCTKC